METILSLPLKDCPKLNEKIIMEISKITFNEPQLKKTVHRGIESSRSAERAECFNYYIKYKEISNKLYENEVLRKYIEDYYNSKDIHFIKSKLFQLYNKLNM